MPEQRDKLVRGSIRVFKDGLFFEDREITEVKVLYDGLDATLHLTTIPHDLREIFDKAGISWNTGNHVGKRLKSVIKGIDFDDIETIDDDYLRIRFCGLTESELQHKLQKAIKWLDEHKIEHGEKDGKVACIFKCLTSEQLELGEF